MRETILAAKKSKIVIKALLEELNHDILMLKSIAL